MKKVFFAAALIGLTFAACSDDDDQATVNASVDGTWKLTGFTLDEAVDLNNDGNESTNLIAETGCYNNSNLTFMSNNQASLTLQELDVEIIGEGNTATVDIDCLPADTVTGNYSVSENAVTLSGELGDGSEDVVLVRSGNTLSVHFDEVTAIPVPGEDDVIVYDFVGATLTFTKQ